MVLDIASRQLKVGDLVRCIVAHPVLEEGRLYRVTHIQSWTHVVSKDIKAVEGALYSAELGYSVAIHMKEEKILVRHALPEAEPCPAYFWNGNRFRKVDEHGTHL